MSRCAEVVGITDARCSGGAKKRTAETTRPATSRNPDELVGDRTKFYSQRLRDERRNAEATLERLGVLASYSRPGVSDDNPFVESLFGTMKTRVGYPKKPFETLEQSQAWADALVRWYNEEHRHSALIGA